MSDIAKTVYLKRPGERLDYDLDYARRWLPSGDTIESVSVAVETTGTLTIDDHEFTDTTVKVWAEGGEDNETAHVTVDVVTAQGREKQVCFRIRVREC